MAESGQESVANMTKDFDRSMVHRDAVDAAPSAGMILLLYDDENLLHKVMLESLVWRVPIQKDLSALANLETSLKNDADDVVHAIYSPSASMLTLASRLRTEIPTAGIAMLRSTSDDAVMRGISLFSGADAFFSQDTLPMEIVAAIQALRRRGHAFARSNRSEHEIGAYFKDMYSAQENVEPAGLETKQPWTLSEGGWTLSTPSGHAVRLTNSERLVLQELITNSSIPVERSQLLALLKGERTETPGRYVDVLIARMRRKFSRYGDELPIRAIRGVGYLFVNKGD